MQEYAQADRIVTADELKTLAEHDLHVVSRVVKFELWLLVPEIA